MPVVDQLIERSNGVRGGEGRERVLRLGALIVACVDPRVDPANIFELKRGEAAVLRVPGGRITPATLQSLVVLSAVAAADQHGRAEVIVMHHTDCGLSHLGPACRTSCRLSRRRRVSASGTVPGRPACIDRRGPRPAVAR